MVTVAQRWPLIMAQPGFILSYNSLKKRAVLRIGRKNGCIVLLSGVAIFKSCIKSVIYQVFSGPHASNRKLKH